MDDDRSSLFVNLESIPQVDSITDFTIELLAYQNEALDQKRFFKLWKSAEPITYNNPLISNWHYAPWCELSFMTAEGKYRLHLFLGGLGILTLPDERQGYITLKPH